jgi:FlaA1/EpsC-like NDP-sugar epimerase
MWGGEIFVPRIPSYRILDVAAAIAPEAETKIVGIRAGEKLHEQLITGTDSLSTVEFDDYFAIMPSLPQWDTDAFRMTSGERPGRMCDPDFSYDSGTNTDFLTVDQLRAPISAELL